MNPDEGKKGIVNSMKLFVQQCRRVLLVASKPDKEEFRLSAKITGIGLAVIGIIGFIIFMVFQLTGLQ